MMKKINKVIIPALAFILIGSLIGCGSGDDASLPTAGGQLIGQNGGTKTSSDNRASVSVPTGALSIETNITVEKALNPPPGNIGDAYEFGPDGTTFNQPVTISIIYNEAMFPSGSNESDLKLGTVVNNLWQVVAGSSVDTASNTVSGETTSFSIYGIISGSGTASNIGPNGGIVTSIDGKASIDIPAGALSEETTITIFRVSSPASGNIGAVYEFGPLGTIFSQPAMISIIYDEAVLPSNINESDLKLGFPVNNKWTAVVGSSIDTNSNKVSVKMGEEFSTFFNTLGVYGLFVAPGTFTSTGDMNVARLNPTTTLLPDGRVLVAGGFVGSGTPATAELYNTTTGTFSFTGNINAASGDHAATLLSNGKVLITGGIAAELYDPATGISSPTGNMKNGHDVHTATLLSDGRVLIAGGHTGQLTPAAPEIYDPATGTFSFSGNMNVPRRFHRATLLHDGKVLIVGGVAVGGGTFLASAELYDPATGTFSLTGSMNSVRWTHTATLLPDGKVLIAGGSDSGGSGNTIGTSAELYDPVTGTFSLTGSMNISHSNHTATLLSNGKVLVAAGFSFFAELYDPASGTFGPTGSLNKTRDLHSATLLSDGRVLITGGRGRGETLTSAELFLE